MRYLLIVLTLSGCASLPDNMSYEQRMAIYDRMRFGAGGNVMYQQQPYTMQVPYENQNCHTVNGVVYC